MQECCGHGVVIWVDSSGAGRYDGVMLIVGIISQKGGAGKTTLALNLAVASELAGRPAIVLDTDPQGSARVWARLRGSSTPLVVGASSGDLPAMLARAREAGAVLALIDTPPHAGGPARAAAQAADVAIVPCRPSILDLEAASASFRLAREAGTPAAGLVWGAPSRSTLGGQAVAALRGAGVQLLGGEVIQRAAYAHAITVGKGVQEYAPGSPAAREIEDLHRLLVEHLADPAKRKRAREAKTAEQTGS